MDNLRAPFQRPGLVLVPALDAPSAVPASPVAAAALAIVTPVFNDWESFGRLVRELDTVARELALPVHVIAVDDGSTAELVENPLGGFTPAHLAAVEVLHLQANFGHQRAIVIGLAECVRRGTFAQVVVMDSDGEDAPAELPRLLDAARGAPGTVVVASRAKRSEGLSFRTAYWFYKHAFRVLTGRQIDFGNFCVLPQSAARRIVYSPEAWNHFAATLVKSRLPLVRVATARQGRYAGESRMSRVSLVVHGLSAISVFVETVITRLLVVFGLTALASLAAAATAFALRFGTNLAIPGWATNVFGLSMLLFFQSATVLTLVLFSVLSSRSSVPFLAGAQASSLIARSLVLFRRTGS